MPSTSDKHREVLRYVYALVGVIATTAVVLSLSVLARNAALDETRARVEQYHVRTLMLAREAAVQVSSLQLNLANGASPEAQRDMREGREIELGVHATQRLLGEIRSVQEAHADPRYAATVERASRQHSLLADLSAVGESAAAALERQAEALALSLFQLDRLHSLAVESTLGALTATRARWTLQLALVGAVVVLLSWILTTRLLRLLRARLVEHEQAEADVLERERRLQHSSKLEALGTLVGGVAHDFNNILTAILGHAQLLRGDQPDEARVHHSADEIHKAAERAADLTRRLLLFSRQEAVESTVVDANLLVCETEEVLRRLIPEDIALEVTYADEVLAVEVDLVQMEQVLLNLAVNARDAMPDGGRLAIRVSQTGSALASTTQQPGRPGPDVRIRVEDDGCGMPPSVLSRIFEPFFTTKQRGHGTGLGLATAHSLVAGCGGALDVTSEPGVGTIFDLYLPLCDSPVAVRDASEPTAPPPRGSETILLAEDEEQVRDLVATGLRSAGYEVLVSHDGPGALRLCEQHGGPIALILTDVVMPGWRGPELVRRVRELQPHARVLYMSGYIDDAILEDAPGQDAPLLTKPVSVSELLQAVRHELDRNVLEEREADVPA